MYRKKLSVPKALMFMYLDMRMARRLAIEVPFPLDRPALPAHRDELRSRKIVQSEIVFEQPRHFDYLVGRRSLASAANL